jgi:predicted nucleic acid-binding protein
MLVDTDVLIWYLRGHEKAARFLEGLRELKLSAVTWMELVQGCRNRRDYVLYPRRSLYERYGLFQPPMNSGWRSAHASA